MSRTKKQNIQEGNGVDGAERLQSDEGLEGGRGPPVTGDITHPRWLKENQLIGFQNVVLLSNTSLSDWISLSHSMSFPLKRSNWDLMSWMSHYDNKCQY